MVKLIQTTAWLDAWIDAAEFLLTNGPTLNLVLEIGEPGRRAYPKEAQQRLDDFFIGEQQLPIHSVAETIFPGSEYRKRGLKGVFEVPRPPTSLSHVSILFKILNKIGRAHV